MSKKSSVIYGVNPIKESLLADHPMSKLYLLQNRRDQTIDAVRKLALQREVRILPASREKLDQMAQTTKHQGMVAFLRATPVHTLQSILENAQGKTPFVFLLDGVEDPRNLGAIIRTVDAAGGDGVIIPARRATGLTATVAKTSAGALAHLPVVQVGNLSPVIDHLKKEGYWVVGLDVAGQTSYSDYDFTGPVAIVLGGEGKGIRKKVLERCDAVLSLPMRGQVQSLNVAVAVGIVAYEVIRQRSLKE
ncbi:MAG: 23S rRNA (guanosine(2251)-2'-O)-methyltransferase RlmB [Nitrospirae bacterium]|nr:23S rRNA (guanosine(2251)-2'-O)-methyltransferase RlmB [Candidatus Manganitrophaceae bacterium]